MGGCACGCEATTGTASHAIVAALADGDVDRALDLGLLDAAPCPGCTRDCAATVLAARDARRTALAARERYRARNARLERRARERAARRAAPAPAPAAAPPGSAVDLPPLPVAAADALARALARAGRKP